MSERDVQRFIPAVRERPDLADTVLAPNDGRLVREVEDLITRYVVLPSAARLPIALWAIATHVFDLFDAFAYLSAVSPVPGCGKTRLLETLELVVANPWRGTAPTEAALFRFIEANRPTLLLDEVEGLGKRNASERDTAVLAILNAGYKKGQTVPRCVGGDRHLENFRVYCPKSFACIGHLPDTLRDRAIVIPMQRRAPGESVARFHSKRAKEEAAPIRAAIEKVVKSLTGEIEQTYSGSPELSFLSDRDEEIFSPLFALCAVLALGRVEELKKDAKSLCDAKAGDAVDDSLPLRLLADVQGVWTPDRDEMLTETLLRTLREMPESPWSGEIELSPRKLARMLQGFDIRPRTVRAQEGRGKGYVVTEFEAAWGRYLPPKGSEGDLEA